MKIKGLVVATVLSLMATASMASTTVVTFPKGSTCSSFTGDYQGRRFLLGLGAYQTLTVSVDADDVIVRDPKGRILRYHGQDYGEWTTRMKGNHTISILPYKGSYGTVEFCAY